MKYLWGLIFFLLTSASYSETYTGHVSILGSQFNRRPFLKLENGKLLAICKGERQKTFKTFSSFLVSVKGIIKNPQVPHKKCLSPDGASLLKTPANYPPLIGSIEQKGETFIVRTEENKEVAVRPGKIQLDTSGKIFLVDTSPKYPNPSKRPYLVIKTIPLESFFAKNIKDSSK